MPLVPKTYDRNTKDTRFYAGSTVVGSMGYNPEITKYYNSADELLRIEEVWCGEKYTQTISGSAYANQTVDYSVTYSAWEKTTVS